MQVSDRQGCKHSQRNTDTKRQRQSQIQETDPRDVYICTKRYRDHKFADCGGGGVEYNATNAF